MPEFNTQLVIRMKDETRKKLEQRAEKEGRKTTQMARVIIERALQREKV